MTTKAKAPEAREEPPITEYEKNYAVHADPNRAGYNATANVGAPATPVITSLTPDTCAIGDPDFTLVVAGEGFVAGSVIHFAGHPEPTTLEADGTLTTGVKPSLWADPVTVQCQVITGSLLSNVVDFAFTAPVAKRAHAAHAAHAPHDVDPDDLEDEIEEAEDDGDVKSKHTPPKRRR